MDAKTAVALLRTLRAVDAQLAALRATLGLAIDAVAPETDPRPARLPVADTFDGIPDETIYEPPPELTTTARAPRRRMNGRT